MKKLLFLLVLILCIVGSLTAQWKSYNGPEGKPVTANILEDGENGTVIEFNVSGYFQRSLNIESKTYSVLSIPVSTFKNSLKYIDTVTGSCTFENRIDYFHICQSILKGNIYFSIIQYCF